MVIRDNKVRRTKRRIIIHRATHNSAVKRKKTNLPRFFGRSVLLLCPADLWVLLMIGLITRILLTVGGDSLIKEPLPVHLELVFLNEGDVC